MSVELLKFCRKETSAGFAYPVKALARAGYVAKGVVYMTVGVIAASALFGWFGVDDIRGTRGAVSAIAAQPLGNVLMILLTAGLIGFVVWRFAQGIADTEDKGSTINGWIHRIGFMISGTMYALLAYYAVRISGWLPAGSSGDSKQLEDFVTKLGQSGTGLVLAGAFGAGFVIVGCYVAYAAVTNQFKVKWETGPLQPSQEQVATRLAQFGLGARALTLLIVGSLILGATLDAGTVNATGLAEALQVLNRQPFGRVLLGAAAAGIFCYGIFCFVNSRLRIMTFD